MLTVGSLFSGIGCIDLGLCRAGLKLAWQCEIEADCRRVLERHWPAVPKFADVKDVGRANLEQVDLIAFGSPCQGLSVAGKREGLADERSNLFFEAVRVVREMRPTFVLWENVAGALSSNDGRDFRAVLHALAECGAVDIAWRILDGQYFGVAQRRRRVWLVADFGGTRAGEILFESDCRCGHPPTRGQAGQRVAGTIRGGAAGRSAGASQDASGNVPNLVFSTLNSGGNDRQDESHETYVTHPLRSEGADASEDGTGSQGVGVRRLMPIECLRLQGLPDDWLDVEPPLSDSAKYRQIGNGAVVPNVEWIGKQILNSLAE